MNSSTQRRLLQWLLLCLLSLPTLVFARGLAFAEEMHGYAYLQGEFMRVDVYFNATIGDIDAWKSDAQHPAKLRGRLHLEDGRWLNVTGTLSVMAPSPGDKGRLLIYAFSGDGFQYLGAKHVYNDALLDTLDDVTRLRGVLAPTTTPLPTLDAIVNHDAWTGEMQFEWWDPANVVGFAASFRVINTWWPPDFIDVPRIFLQVYFSGLAAGLFPWLLP